MRTVSTIGANLDLAHSSSPLTNINGAEERPVHRGSNEIRLSLAKDDVAAIVTLVKSL